MAVIQVTYYAAGERVGAFDSFDEVASGNAQDIMRLIITGRQTSVMAYFTRYLLV